MSIATKEANWNALRAGFMQKWYFFRSRSRHNCFTESVITKILVFLNLPNLSGRIKSRCCKREKMRCACSGREGHFFSPAIGA